MDSPNKVPKSANRRQHERVEIKPVVSINGEDYSTSDLSLSGTKLDRNLDSVATGAIIECNVDFLFEGVTVSLTLYAKVVSSKDEPHARLKFLSLNEPQTEFLRLLIDHYLNSTLRLDAGFVSKVNLEAPETSKTRNWFRTVALYSFAALLMATALYLGHSKLITPKSEVAFIGYNNRQVVAPASGIMHWLVGLSTMYVRADEILFEISVNEGNDTDAPTFAIPVKSPCDCVLSKETVNDGERIWQGQPVAALSAPMTVGDQVTVFSSISKSQAKVVKKGTSVEMNFPEIKNPIAGHVIRIDHSGIWASEYPKFKRITSTLEAVAVIVVDSELLTPPLGMSVEVRYKLKYADFFRAKLP